jgi:hypothetical protein
MDFTRVEFLREEHFTDVRGGARPMPLTLGKSR